MLNGKRIIIPDDCRNAILKDSHIEHQEIVRIKRRSRNTVYCPTIDGDIENTVRECEVCQNSMPSQQKEEFMEREEPTRPYEQVAADFFSYENQE